MHGTPSQFQLRAPPAVTKERARARFAEASGRAYTRIRIALASDGDALESPLADWPGAPGPTPGVALAAHVEAVKAEMGAVLVAMDALGVTAEAVRATAESRAVEYLGGAL